LAPKSSFADCHEEIVQMTTARQLANIILKHKSCLYSQWLADERNSVSDALSSDFHLTDESLTKLILSSIPQQAPFGVRIKPLPKEIISWLTNLLQISQKRSSGQNYQLKHYRSFAVKPDFGFLD
jgi:hypothetical protein